MSQFTSRMDTETFQVFWAALQRGEFISGAAEQIGTYRKQGSRWVRACGGVRPRRGRDLKGRCLTFAEREEVAALVLVIAGVASVGIAERAIAGRAASRADGLLLHRPPAASARPALSDAQEPHAGARHDQHQPAPR